MWNIVESTEVLWNSKGFHKVGGGLIGCVEVFEERSRWSMVVRVFGNCRGLYGIRLECGKVLEDRVGCFEDSSRFCWACLKFRRVVFCIGSDAVGFKV